MAKPELLRRIEGGILGSAIGDAMAAQEKQMIPGEASKILSQVWTTDLPAKNHYTGSTETAVKVAEVISANIFSEDAQIHENIALNLAVWLSDMRETSKPSDATIKALKQFIMTNSHFESWVEDSMDASPIVRSIPIGLTYFDKPGKLKTLAVNQAAITHKSPVAIVCAEMVGLFVSWAMLGITPTAYVENIFKYYDRLNEDWQEYLDQVNSIRPERFKLDREFFESGWSVILEKFEKVPDSLEDSPFEIHKKLGNGFNADDALATALYCLMKSPESYREAVVTSSNLKTPRNYISSVVGGISGAYLKIDAIPDAWKNTIEFKGKLLDTAALLYLGLIE